jgi:hypothetical protein
MRSTVWYVAAMAVMAVPTDRANGQFAPRFPEVPRTARVRVEGFLSNVRYELGTGSADRLAGAGGRVLFSLVDRSDPSRSTVLSRAAVGAFASRATDGQGELKTTHAGVQADLTLTQKPLARYVEPVVSVGVGVLREERNTREDLFSHIERTITAVSPAVGVRVAILPGVAIRGDFRDVIPLRGSRRAMDIAFGMSMRL